MKRIIALVFAILFTLAAVVDVSAQTNESIWLTANTTAYKTGESVIVDLNASSATPIQGFTFQVRYDPACLEPVSASSPISGMNGLPLPQLTGLVDGSYASTTPQTVSGKLAEIKFTALKGCQTGVTLESAALAVRSAEGFASSLPGVSMGASNIALNIDRQAAAPQTAAQSAPQAESGSILPLNPPEAPRGNLVWMFGMVGIVMAVLAGSMIFSSFLLLRGKKSARGKASSPARAPTAARAKATSSPPRAPTASQAMAFIPTTGAQQAALHIKHGPHAGKSISLTRLPVLIGCDPLSDICFNDPYIIRHHAQIYSNGNGYYLRDLGGATFINGHRVKSSEALLRSGDVVRLGKSVLFVFG